ncbi:CPBP family intramembrane glutamic endopeptidase [Haloimpatiens sp. FM7330]|uniref:CPBP family intramembrane glutamic endopeptidase n=1 Tax=Haloimpatiens sp. FM7330 TaxID=3298610 RepID=UPI00363309E1
MNFFKSIETGKIKIQEFGVWGSVGVFLVIFILLNIISIPGVIISVILEHSNKSIVPIVNLIAEIITYLLVAVIVINWVKVKEESLENEENIKEGRKFTKIKFKYLGIVILMVMGYGLIYDNSLEHLVSQVGLNPVVKQHFEELSKTPIIMFISVAVVAPIFEETFFRGIILNGLSKKVHPVLAVIISALFFAIMHGNVIQGVNTFLLGSLIGIIFIKTRSLYLCMFAHFINNTLRIITSGILQQTTTLGKFSIISIIPIVIGLVMLVLAYKLYKKNKNELCGISEDKMYEEIAG